MNCVTRLIDTLCDESAYESLVLAIDKSQVDEFLIKNGRIYFNLKEGEKAKVLGQWINKPSFSKSYNELQGTRSYKHTAEISVNGLTEKTINEELDGLEGDYFIAIKTTEQDVLILGFNNLMTAEDYNYTDGANLVLSSKEDEFEKPYFFSVTFEGEKIGAKDAFDNRFRDIEFSLVGDFNDDFNDDFYE